MLRSTFLMNAVGRYTSFLVAKAAIKHAKALVPTISKASVRYVSNKPTIDPWFQYGVFPRAEEDPPVEAVVKRKVGRPRKIPLEEEPQQPKPSPDPVDVAVMISQEGSI